MNANNSPSYGNNVIDFRDCSDTRFKQPWSSKPETEIKKNLKLRCLELMHNKIVKHCELFGKNKKRKRSKRQKL